MKNGFSPLLDLRLNPTVNGGGLHGSHVPFATRCQAAIFPMAGSFGIGSGDGHLHGAGFYRQGHALLGTHLQTANNRFPDIVPGLLAAASLAYATRDRRTFGDPHAILVALQSDDKLHGEHLPPSAPLVLGLLGLLSLHSVLNDLVEIVAKRGCEGLPCVADFLDDWIVHGI